MINMANVIIAIIKNMKSIFLPLKNAFIITTQRDKISITCTRTT